MNKKIVSIVLALSLLLPVTANAGFLKTMVESWGFTFTITASDTLDLFGALADDIGEMADRILVMADKIVATEQLMADMVVQLAEINAGIATLNTTSTVPTVLINSDVLTITSGVAPTFTISDLPTEYVVYVSSTLIMSTTTTSLIIHNNDELQAQWFELEALSTNGNIYIAVKSINANTISSLSNVLTFNIL
ncbi:MAG: hypothetical protein COA44_08500 [Arcobacter sp.]|nr:MAG: hypothetical protein COA44_08500 [Arcobacter sp.]